ncbi:MAG TPA: hypothetical protein PL059_01130 [Spirochaetota bacterium]|nr:hypothetical protein [Spirochaetota bacterium]HOM08738.1 hypothetical protein [Spirochaetota bacterium]HPP48472.1 hypothetical protein [Spirochaetota bacterium]
MKKNFLTIIMVLFTSVLLAQTTQKLDIPVQSLYSNQVKIKDIYFNRRVDIAGKGDVLEVEVLFENLTDYPMDIYVNIIATYEKEEKTKSSFEMPIPEKERIRNFVPYPDDIANYEYTDSKGKKIFQAYPKNTKSGINPLTNKLYFLPVRDILVVRSYHVSPYRKDFIFFNYVTVLVFDKDGNPIMREVYELKGKRK